MANNDQNNNKNGKGRNNLRGILTLVAWALVLTVGFNYLNAYNRNATNKSTSHEIKYSEMLDLIENDKAKEVLFKDDAIYITPVEGYTYTEEQDEDSNVPAKSYTQSKDTKLTLYTAYLNDTSLLPLLKEHKVAYTGYYEAQMNPVLAFMVSYILPTLIFVGLLMLLLRMLAKSGGSGFGFSLGLGSSFGLGGLQLLSLVLNGRDAGLGVRASLNGLQGAFGTFKALVLLPVAGDVQQLEDGLGRLSADAEPVLSAIRLDLDGRGLGVGVVGTDLLDDLAVTLLAGIDDHHTVEGVELLALSLQTNLGCQNGSPCNARCAGSRFAMWGMAVRNPRVLAARGVEGATRARITGLL